MCNGKTPAEVPMNMSRLFTHHTYISLNVNITPYLLHRWAQRACNLPSYQTLPGYKDERCLARGMWRLNNEGVPPEPFWCAPNGRATCRCHPIASNWGWSHPSPLLVFHVGHISDRRVIKAAINARPFPVPLSCRAHRAGLRFHWTSWGNGGGRLKPPS